MHRITTTLENFNTKLWQYHVRVPDEIAMAYIEGDNRRVYATFNNQVKIQAALMKVEAYWFVLVNKKNRDKLGLHEGDSVELTLEKDRTEFGHVMPEELEVLLDQDEEGNEFFRSLTKGKQRSLIYLITKVKNPDSRMKKSLAIVHHLKEVQGKLDFKKLMETIKFYNNRF